MGPSQREPGNTTLCCANEEVRRLVHGVYVHEDGQPVVVENADCNHGSSSAMLSSMIHRLVLDNSPLEEDGGSWRHIKMATWEPGAKGLGPASMSDARCQAADRIELTVLDVLTQCAMAAGGRKSVLPSGHPAKG